MPANSSLNLTSLDFDTLKANFIQFLKSQTIFQDYDFTGSNLNVLLDIMCYNTYLNSFYLNMVGSEAFLDSAQLRASVVSRAKELNYIPQSARSAVAQISISANTIGLNGILSIPSGTLFSGRNSNGSYFFVTEQTYTSLSTGNKFNISNVAVYEGKLLTESFIVDNTIENQKFILSNQNIDDSFIQVTVSQDSGSNVTSYTQATNLFGLGPTSTVFFVQEDPGQLYEIYFGDGVFGYVPVNDSLITIKYRVTNGSDANGISRLSLGTNLGIFNGGQIAANVTVTSNSADGSSIESISSIKYRAPRFYQMQDRAITSSDYKNMIIDNFPEVEDVSVYGGEDISGSVQYGTVFLSATTTSGNPISQSTEDDIVSFLEDKKSISVTTSFVEPDYVFIVPAVSAFVDFSQTINSPSQISTEIILSVNNYNTSSLQTFNATFMLSKLAANIDASDSGMRGSQTSLSMYKNVIFSNGVSHPIVISFNNPVSPGTIYSSDFVLDDGKTYQLTDFNPNNNTFKGTYLANGQFSLINTVNTLYFNQISTNNVQNYIFAGTVDYGNGIISVGNITVFDFINEEGIQVFCTPAVNELYGAREIVLKIDLNLTTVAINPV
jgi:hypothetical protein